MTQTEEMKKLFELRPFQWIPLPSLMKIAAQYNARISELRGDGMNIKNKTEKVNGKKHSWYRYLPDGYLF